MCSSGSEVERAEKVKLENPQSEFRRNFSVLLKNPLLSPVTWHRLELRRYCILSSLCTSTESWQKSGNISIQIQAEDFNSWLNYVNSIGFRWLLVINLADDTVATVPHTTLQQLNGTENQPSGSYWADLWGDVHEHKSCNAKKKKSKLVWQTILEWLMLETHTKKDCYSLTAHEYSNQ